MYRGNGAPTALKFHLGPLTRNTTFEAEAVGTSLGLQLLLTATLPGESTISLDNQGVIQSTAIYRQRQSHYHFDAIHNQAKKPARKEKDRPNHSLTIVWISGHSGAEGNKEVDTLAKEAAEGSTSNLEDLPEYLKKLDGKLPASISALKQVHNRKLKTKWKARWSKSPRCAKYAPFKDDFPFTGFQQSIRGTNRPQRSLLIQLRTGHAPLNQHLCRMKQRDSAYCEHCRGSAEMVSHFLLDCRGHEHARIELRNSMGNNATNLEALFGTREGVRAMLQFIAKTERLKKTFGDVSPTNITDDNDDERCTPATDESTNDWDKT